ncbi:TIGR03085 family metal-binding protein [Allorhizocola rhizosphaerae]|uniref:TIGR03085 family metal-binding protein n=1 Tax=Allorhizocola rhizosphaerae TaxID=1872709 RepID=UPI000E3D25EE|nr:TIGR03085 family metal-binding protein [Allorhizocola rhizosphaerae]
MTRYAFAERLALAHQMERVGPDAPTLCGEWTVRELLAHLLLRERRPDAAVGILIKRFGARTEHVQRDISAGDFAALLAALRRPPWWSPVSNVLLDELTNLTEMFVHHEDVRRAQAGWAPRELSHGLEAALFTRVRAWARLALRRYPATVRIETPGFGSVKAGTASPDVLTLSGPPGELLLFLFGRQAHARAELSGPPEAAERLRRARLGI